ncbi:hypothetical protein ANCDUO_08450 [Ancylostoma duodenale]|uniref:Uncharacterized protein n=1 Tax=Ancylostoma duodenale TaxID=51022 RepID=A0A0C2CWH1_9BILA|nr:hypothetical protein ANCDUO_08450 [Ancylostoma duodenale]
MPSLARSHDCTVYVNKTNPSNRPHFQDTIQVTTIAAAGAMGGRGAGGGGIVSHLGYAVTPTLAPTAVASMPIAGRRGSSVRQSDKATPDRPPADNSKQDSLDDRASSKLTLDDELFDILYAFG